jgi:hypothetical protein
MESTVETKTWPELAGGLYDKLSREKISHEDR